MPRFSDGQDRLKAQARRVASVMRFASDAAAARKAQRALKFDMQAKTLTYDQDGRMVTYALESLIAVEMTSRGMVTEGELVVIFDPQGFNETLNVHLQDDEQSLTVSYSPISRKVRILEPEHQEADTRT